MWVLALPCPLFSSELFAEVTGVTGVLKIDLMFKGLWYNRGMGEGLELLELEFSGIKETETY